jgi:peroxiredoxin (alkyl hydroperoxide reductase subunit C)
MISVGNKFPSFELTGVDFNNEFVGISSDEMDSNWSVVYFYPKDFTFICPTEIKAMDILVDHALVIGISGDNEFCKKAWKEQEGSLITNIKHTLAADCGLGLAEDCGIVDWENGVCFRATFIIDPQGIIQHITVNALDTGRNAWETLRTLSALQAGGLTGCSWQEGEDFVG